MGKRPHDTQRQIRHGRILAGEGQIFLHKGDMNAPWRNHCVIAATSARRSPGVHWRVRLAVLRSCVNASATSGKQHAAVPLNADSREGSVMSELHKSRLSWSKQTFNSLTEHCRVVTLRSQGLPKWITQKADSSAGSIH